MKYYFREDTLFIRGLFRAASTGPAGGLGNVSTLIVHTVKKTHDNDITREMDTRISFEGLPHDYFGVPVTTPIRYLCIIQYDFITVFILTEPGQGPVTIIVYSGEGFSDEALLGAIITATEAKVAALYPSGRNPASNCADNVIIASEGPACHTVTTARSEVGKRIFECITFGIPEALKADISRDQPALHVYSRFGGGHFVEWTPKGCPYYPCHFEGQRCDFCYCPFYPCGDEQLGQWVKSSNGGRVWNCSRCQLLHIPETADYLKRNPEASLTELKQRAKTKKQVL
jgi:adenosylcobinamide hydrolase